MKNMKSMGCYEFAALLICVFWFVGCGGSTPTSSNSGSNPKPVTAMNRATSKFLSDVNSMEETVQGFVMAARREGVVGAAVETWVRMRLDRSDVHPSGTLMAKCPGVAPQAGIDRAVRASYFVPKGSSAEGPYRPGTGMSLRRR